MHWTMRNNSSSSPEHLHFWLIAVKLQACLTGLQKGLPSTYSTCPVNKKQYERRWEQKNLAVIGAELITKTDLERARVLDLSF